MKGVIKMKKEEAIKLAQFYINTKVLSDTTKIMLLKNLQKCLQN